ncbi:hypothetical protein AYO40_01995 [Planctomycetaceae bacterium SCGC AG-212-D15]|nr:hypothetical protein AYO40_01995 [Planctomycetaceae bacterium SCGC AG-212-D15]
MNIDLLVDIPRLRTMSTTLRRWIIERAHASNVGHIGSALSIVEVLSVLWGKILRNAGTAVPDRDRFILSKGHASLALYAAMRYVGVLDERIFNTYCADGSHLGVHPDHGLPGIDLSAGSLGQGLSVGCGLSYGLRRTSARVDVLLSDAELNEGQVWEAAMFAGHHRLGNLTAIVDINGMQALGPTRKILDLHSLAEQWAGFGWLATNVDGHDVEALLAALNRSHDPRPHLVLAYTTNGKGVSFMENQLSWHYANLSAELCHQALAELR